MLVNEESFRAEMKKLKDKWGKKTVQQISSHSLFEWFKNYKTDIMISYMIEAVRKENGLIVFEVGNDDQYLAQFTNNGIESMNAELNEC